MRLDQFLVQFKQIESRTKAQELIDLGLVYIKKEKKVYFKKSSQQVEEADFLFIEIDPHTIDKYVSRAGYKLEGAVQQCGLKIAGQTVLDVGQSTGGFTDYLIQNFARQVIGLDVGHSQLHSRLKNHSQVVSIENLNVKNIKDHELLKDRKFDIIVCDVSFISLTKVIPCIANNLSDKGHFLFLVKPQFECGPHFLDKNGVVTDASIYSEIQKNIELICQKEFNAITVYFESVIQGKEGNREFFVYGQKNSKNNDNENDNKNDEAKK